MSEQSVEAFGNVEQTLAVVEEHLAVLKQTSLDEFIAPLSHLERAKVQVSLGTCTNPSGRRVVHCQQLLHALYYFHH